MQCVSVAWNVCSSRSGAGRGRGRGHHAHAHHGCACASGAGRHAAMAVPHDVLRRGCCHTPQVHSGRLPQVLCASGERHMERGSGPSSRARSPGSRGRLPAGQLRQPRGDGARRTLTHLAAGRAVISRTLHLQFTFSPDHYPIHWYHNEFFAEWWH